jgi:Protein of unknown function (DUF1553)/Protein of unknown function (DUF1549)
LNRCLPSLPALVVAVACLCAVNADAKPLAVGAAGDASRLVDFTNDVVPLFTKLGCNSGGCHGKATGRGGFKLSLFGFEPTVDYEAITRGARGRRVFPAEPSRSLLLRKPLMQVPHGGGRRFAVDSPEHRLLKRWIAEGTPWGRPNAARIAKLVVIPSERVLRSGRRQRLAATAVYSDGSRRDVTRLVEYRSNTTAIAEVTGDGLVTATGRTGETAVVLQYQGQIAVCTVTVPLVDPNVPRPELANNNLIDRHVLAKLRKLNVPPSSPAADSVFLRRATLQIAGRLPTLGETRTFLADRDPRKQRKLIDRLLCDPGYADVQAQQWSALLRNKRRAQDKRIPGTKAFHKWIRDSFARNVPFDRFARAILTATGDFKSNPPVQWYAEVRYLDRYVDDTAQVFLGVRIGCARCHHHPFENFSQDDYFGLAAFFARVGRTGGTGGAERAANETIYVKATGSVKRPGTGRVVLPRGLGGEPLEIPPCDDPRRSLAEWMTSPDNPCFAKAFVNRLWAQFFGRGIVEERDDMRSTNPPANAALLDALAAEFVRSKFDVKHMVRLIGNSTTYQLSATPNRWNGDETRAHSRFYPRRLDAELLLDAVDAVTGKPTKYDGLPTGMRAMQLPDEGYSNTFLKMYGRPERMSACACERDEKPTLRQFLFLMNDRFVLEKIYASDGYACQLAKDQRPTERKVEELFLKALSRKPTPAERARAKRHLVEVPDAVEAWGDLIWAMINSKEFLFVR